jgi:hypothetical protein
VASIERELAVYRDVTADLYSDNAAPTRLQLPRFSKR